MGPVMHLIILVDRERHILAEEIQEEEFKEDLFS
jgi:hypothetical protein